MESFLVESGYYLLLAGFLQAVLALLIAPVFLLVGRRLFGISYWPLLRTYLIFNGFLLVWGCLGSYIFLRIAYGKLYVSADRMFDWLPFAPFGRWVLDQTLGPLHGHLIGNTTLRQLRLLWLAVAIPVWLLAFVSTALVVRRSFWPFPPFRNVHAHA